MRAQVETRNCKGRYDLDIEDMRNRSLVSGIIHDELDKFWENATSRLSTLEVEGMDEETIKQISEAKKDLKSAIALRFGNPLASSCVTILHGPSGWNGYQKDNFNRVRMMLRESDGKGGLLTPYCANIDPSFKEVQEVLSREWKEFDEARKKNYPVRGKDGIEPPLNHIIADQEEHHRRKRRKLWNNMKNECDQLDSIYGVATMLFYADKHNLHKAPQVYWARANEKDSRNPVELYYNQLNEHKLTESAMAVAVQAHTQGFIQLDGKTSKSKKSPKEIDTLRIKFRRIIIEKYNELANELGTRPITKKSLPKHFFTNHLKDLGWRLEGVSDVMGMKDVKDIKMDRMKQIIAGLEEGNVRFVDLGVNL